MRGAEAIKLSVTGLRARDLHTARDNAPGDLSDDDQAIWVATEMCAKSLYGDGLIAFRDGQQLRELMTESETHRLLATVQEAWRTIAPLQGSCSLEWKVQLELGALHSTNLADSLLMSDCVESVPTEKGSRFIFRPDRFYGVEVRKLTDGQLMAFDAGYTIVRRLRDQQSD